MLTPNMACSGETTRRERGQSLVEFALVLGFVILPLTMVFIESSVLLYQYVALTNATREGARAGSIYLYVGDPGGSTDAADALRKEAVAEAVSGTLRPLMPAPPDCDGTIATTTCQISYGPPNDPLPASPPIPDPLRSTDAMTVTLVYTHSFLFGALGNEMAVRAQSSMRIEPSSVISGTGP
jgi:Flp pilus assembly protein TadG